MPTIYVSLHDDDNPPRVQTLTLSSGESFVNICIGNGFTVTLSGYDEAAVSEAYDLAGKITVAADALAKQLAQRREYLRSVLPVQSEPAEVTQ